MLVAESWNRLRRAECAWGSGQNGTRGKMDYYYVFGPLEKMALLKWSVLPLECCFARSTLRGEVGRRVGARRFVSAVQGTPWRGNLYDIVR